MEYIRYNESECHSGDGLQIVGGIEGNNDEMVLMHFVHWRVPC